MQFFFYGTLLDRTVRARVIGRADLPMRRAALAGWRRVSAADGDYPILLRAPGGAVEGLVARGITAAEAARLDAYEGAGYVRRLCPVRTGTGHLAAWAYLPVAGHAHDRRPWDLDLWRRTRRRRYLARLAAMR